MLVLKVSARFPLNALAAALLGVLNALSFMSDAAWPLQIVVLAALFALVLRQRHAASAWRCGMAFGLGWFLVGISWIYVSLHTYGLLSIWLSALATLALCAYLALFPAAALGLIGGLAERGESTPVLLAMLPLAWTLGELLRGVLLSGFPWLATGYAQIGGPLAGFAPVFGVSGVTLATAACAASLSAFGLHHRSAHARRRVLAVLVIFIALGAALNQATWSKASGPALRVRLLQGDIDQEVKFNADQLQRTLAIYFKLIEAAPADLIVLPETAIPIFINDLPEQVIDRLRRDSAQLHAVIAVGVPVADGADRYTNSMIAFSADGGRPARYDKAHLVPFGEFVPFGFHWFVRLLRIPLGDFTAGAPHPEPLHLAGQSIGFDICYEDLFAPQMARQARQASVLVNMSNVAWFGNSLALPEHLQIARMRARETARPVLRATNTGMTAMITPDGQVVQQLAPFTQDVLSATVQPMSGATPYSLWLDWPLWLACWTALLSSGWRWRHRLGRQARLK